MTDVKRKSGAAAGAAVTAEDLAAINALARTDLTEAQVYTFALRLCDNEVDRDFERFSRESLEKLGELFVGRSGIFDHDWSAKGQTARIYRTELVEEPAVLTQAGDSYCYLKAFAYMLRSEKNQELIDEIEAGIKKEVSVGCSVKRRVCSICGQDPAGGNCGHRPGEVYDGTLCYVTLEQPADAYEWSFVAVPAQREAGVIRKGCGGSLKTFLKRQGEQGWLRQLEQLEKEAAMGRSYIQQLRKDLVRLAGLAHTDLDCAIFAKTVGRMEEQELLELKRVYEEQLNRGHIPGVQLRSISGKTGEDGEAFLV